MSLIKVIHRSPVGLIQEKYINAVSIQDAISIMNIPVNTYPTVCVIKEQPILRKDWDGPIIDLLPNDCNELKFITMPQGDTFRDILSLVATIALTVVAPYLATALGGILGITSAIGVQLLAAGIVLAGSFLIGTFLSTSGNANASAGSESASPTYTLTGQGNTARLYQPIPKLYGKHQIYPDYAAQPYSEYINNQQYLNVLLCLGLGEYEQHSWNIEDTEFWNSVDGLSEAFDGIQYQYIPPNTAVTLFHSQVVTSTEVSNQDLNNWGFTTSFTFSGNRITSNDASTNESYKFPFAVVGQIVTINNGPFAGNYTIIVVSPNKDWIEVSGGSWTSTSINDISLNLKVEDTYVGPYVANSASTITNKIQVDFILSQGLYYAADDGSIKSNSVTVITYARQINSAGIPISSYIVLGTHTYSASTLTPQRFTETYSVNDARYEVRVRRSDFQNASSRYRSSISWGALKAFIPNDNLYPDVTLLALRILATGQLSQSAAKKINTIQTSKLPIWNGTAWSAPTATRSIAWITSDILRNTIYGADYDDAYIDLTQLLELDRIWTERGDTFNGIFDSTYTIWDALTSVLRAGRTSPVMIGGTLTAVRDQARSIPRGVFTPANIERSSMQIQHILFDDESPDDIIIQFVDERTWKQNEVRCTLTDSLSDKPQRMQLFGITNRTQAWREGMFLAAVNAKRRIIATFTTEMEGRLVTRGDLVTIAYDLFEWGKQGLIDGYDPTTKIVYITEPVNWTLSQSYILLRKRNGKGWGPVKIIPNPDDLNGDYSVKIDAVDLLIIEAAQGPISNVWAYDNDAVMTSYIIGDTTSVFKDFIIVSGKPGDTTTELTCIVENDTVHEVDLGLPPSEVYPYTSNNNPSRPIIAWVSGSEIPGSNPNAPTVNFAWGTFTTASSYTLQISYDNTTWYTIYYGPALTYTYTVVAGPLFYRVCGINTQSGPYKNGSKVFGINTSTPLPVTLVTYTYNISAGILNISWSLSIRALKYRIRLYAETTPGSGIFNDIVITSNNVVANTIQYNSTEIVDAGGPWNILTIGITAINDIGESTEVLQTTSNATLDNVTGLILSTTYIRNTFTAQWNSQAITSTYEVKIEVGGVTKITYTALTNSQTVQLSDMVAVGGPWRQLVVKVKAIAGTLSSAVASLTVTAPTILAVSGTGGSYDSMTEKVTLDWYQTEDNAVNQTKVYKNSTNDFSTATLINTQTKAAGVAASYIDSVTVGTGNVYYFITAYDSVLSKESTPIGLMVTT